MECPVCLEPYGVERPAVGPSGFNNGCTHSFCEPCGFEMRRAGRPFRRAICRGDYTEWFVDTFCWLPPEYTDAAEIRQFVSDALGLLRGQGPNQLLETGQQILRHL